MSGSRRRFAWRRAAVPESLRSRVVLSDGERVLGWSLVGADGWLVATDRALVASVVGYGSDDEPLRVPWAEVLRARWADGALEVVRSRGGGLTGDRLVFDVSEDGQLAEAVQTQVTSSLLWSQRIEDATRGAFVAARRAPDGGSDWTVVFDRGLDASDPSLQEWADGQVAEIRAQTGL